MRGDGHELHVVLEREGVVIGIERLEDDHLVVGIAGHRKGDLQGLAAAVGDIDVRSLHIDADSLVITGKTFTERIVAAALGIGDHFQLVVLHRVEGFLRRFDVRLTDIEMVNLDSAFLGSVRERDEFADGRGGHGLRLFG